MQKSMLRPMLNSMLQYQAQQTHSGMTQKGGPVAPGGGKLACNIAPAESGVLCMYCKFTETSKTKIVGDDD
jgi:hypothetical protein